MRGNLTSPYQNIDETDLPYLVNQRDPQQLRLIIEALIKKSKIVIEALEVTVSKLQKIEEERDYWKISYFRFKQICQKYIDSEGVHNFRQLVDLQSQLKKLQLEKSCLIQESRIKQSRKVSVSKIYGSASQANKRIGTGSKQKQLGKQLAKSINTISYSRVSPKSEHQIQPKTIKITTLFKNKRDMTQ